VDFIAIVFGWLASLASVDAANDEIIIGQGS
jgi:hypothetical protein